MKVNIRSVSGAYYYVYSESARAFAESLFASRFVNVRDAFGEKVFLLSSAVESVDEGADYEDS